MFGRSYKNGFTLIELAIAITVIGLILAGVVSGTTLIRGAELKAIVKDKNRFHGFVSQFELIYESLPGDIRNATDFWPATTNGNGDGLISAATEAFLAVDQLEMAELIVGDYSGSAGSAFSFPTGGVTGNVYSTSVDGVGAYIRCCIDADYETSLDFDNVISVFSISESDASRLSGAVSPIDALGIDRKYDDGLPDAGFIGAIGAWSSGESQYVVEDCFSGVGGASEYDSTGANKDDPNACQMLFGYDWD